MQLIKFSGLSDAQNARLAKLISYKVGFHKLWTRDSGRALTGAYKGTLIGIFPKLTITIKPQTNADRNAILKIVNQDYCDITYYDTSKGDGQMVTKQFYFGDVTDEIKKAVGNSEAKIKHAAIEIEAVATTKRT